MDRLYRHILTVVFLALGVIMPYNQLSATHIVGGDMTYRCIGNGRYEITLEVRRDCEYGDPDAPFDLEAIIGIFDGSGNKIVGLGSNGLFLFKFMGDDTINDTLISDCLVGGNDVCVHRAIYKDTVQLPYRANGYILAYQRCCRNTTLNNIVDPLLTGMTLAVNITPKAQLTCNKQPQWDEWPNLYTCADDLLVIDQGATDEDGDSLVYRLVSPYSGATFDKPKPDRPSDPPYRNDTVVWRAPAYSLQNIMGGDPLTIDSNTGVITGRPNTPGQYLVAVLVEEFRDGELISSRMRNFQINVRPCGDSPDSDFTFDEDPCDSDYIVDFENLSNGAISYKWYFQYPDSSITSEEENPSHTYPGRGMYTVVLVAENAEGCTDTTMKVVKIFNPDIRPKCSIMTTCKDSLLVTLCDSSTGLFPIVHWNWMITIGNKMYVDSGEKVTILLDTTGEAEIKLTVTDSVGCTAQRKYTRIFELLDASFLPGKDSCDNGLDMPFINTSVGANEYKWYFEYPDTSKSSTEENPTHIYNDRGTYQVMLIASNDSMCIDTFLDTITLLDPQLYPDFTFTSTCEDSLVLSLMDSSKSYFPIIDWDWTVELNGQIFKASGPNPDVVLNEDGKAIITLKITDSVGCMAVHVDTAELNYIDIEFISDTLTICLGDSTRLLENADSTLTYEWKPNTGLNLEKPWDPWASPDTTTRYVLCVSDSVCTVMKDVLVQVLPIQDVQILGDTNSCDGKFTLIALSNSSDKFEWSWDREFKDIIGIGDTIMVMVDTVRKIYVRTGMEGDCRGIDSITLYNRSICLEYATERNLCVGDTLMINLINCKPEQNLFIRWDQNDVILSPLDSPGIKVLVPDTGRYTLYFMAANNYGCVLRDSIVINADTRPGNLSLSVISECNNPVVKIIVSGDLVSNYKYVFGDSQGITTSEPMIEHEYDSNGVYNIKVTAGNNGCDTMLFASVEVVFFELDSLDDAILLCGGGMVELNPNGNPHYVYRWTPADKLDDSTAVNPKATVTETTRFRVIVMDSTLWPECKDTAYVDVIVPPSIDIEVSGDSLLCGVDSTTLTANVSNPNAEVSWCDLDGNVIDTGTTITLFPPLGTTCYIVKGIDNLGCLAMKTVCVERYLFDYDIMAETEICEGDSAMVMITNLDMDTLTIDDQRVPPGDKITLFFAPDSSTAYEVPISNDFGCFDTAAINITVVNLNVVATADPYRIILGESTQLEVRPNGPGYTYQWTPNDGSLSDTTIYNPIATPTDTTIYTVKVTDQNGCMGTDTVEVIVISAECTTDYVYVPNAFTPNNDAVNNVLYVRSQIVDELEFVIYNRWGTEVFRTTDINVGWDGTYNGELLRPDVYSYYLWVRCIGQEELVVRGNVTLLK